MLIVLIYRKRKQRRNKDLDNESGSDKDEVEDEANVVVGLVATLSSDAESRIDSEDENEVYSKIPSLMRQLLWM